MSKNKLILSVIILIFILLWGVWIFIYIKEAKKPQKEVQTKTPAIDKSELVSSLTVGPSSKIIKEKAENISFPFLFSEKEIIYFSDVESRFFSYNLDNNLVKSLEAINLENQEVLDVKYYPQSEKILIFIKKEERTKDEENLAFLINNPLTEKIVYDTKTAEVFFIKNPRYLQVELLPGDNFVYYYYDEKEGINKINEENLKKGGLERKELYDLGIVKNLANIEFYGIYDDKLYYSLKEKDTKFLFALDLNSKGELSTKLEINKKIISDFNAISFSPQGSKIFYGSADNKYFFIYDLVNNNFREIKFGKGLLDNILWTKDEKYFYYLEGEQEEVNDKGDYYNLTRKIWKFDIENNTKEIIEDLSSEGKIGIKDIFLSFDEKNLYFINFADNNLYRLSFENK